MGQAEIAEAEAALAMKRLEDELTTSKEDGPASAELKRQVREARELHRSFREHRGQEWDGEKWVTGLGSH